MDSRNAVKVLEQVAKPNKSICGSLGKGKKISLDDTCSNINCADEISRTNNLREFYETESSHCTKR